MMELSEIKRNIDTYNEKLEQLRGLFDLEAKRRTYKNMKK